MLSMTLEAPPVNFNSSPLDPDGYRPSFDFGARPDAWSRAYHLGFTLSLEGEDPAIPAGLPGNEARAFEAGVIAGVREATQEHDLYLDELSREREAELFLESGRGWHPDETIRAVGVIEARMSGVSGDHPPACPARPRLRIVPRGPGPRAGLGRRYLPPVTTRG